MVFSSLPFLYVFLPIVLICYYLAPRKFRNAVLLLSSLLFYFYGEPRYTVLLIVSSIADFIFGLKIEKNRGKKSAKAWLVGSISLNLVMLGFFKYIDFFINTFNSIAGTGFEPLGIALPIGISFFTFQTMSYTIDVYRGNVKAQRNLSTFATYVCLFPGLIAGPIVRYSEISVELESRKERIADISDGIRRFCVGLLKKVLIANMFGELIEIFRGSNESTVLFHWMYAFAFAFQLYFDFSGYSDMAIGLGKMFGFKFPENFNYPYISKSITEFWRRWHMTLGNWFKDYVYIPLGGNRVRLPRWVLNIMIVWMLTGFWHGADWNFIIWGGMMGAFLLIERFFIGNILKKIGPVLPRLYMIFIIVISFVIFNGEGFSGTMVDLGGLFGVGESIALTGAESLYYLRSFAFVFIFAAIFSTPIAKIAAEKALGSKHGEKVALLQPLLVGVILILVTGMLVAGSFNPFLYFRF